MGPLEMSSGDPRSNAQDIIEDFIDGVQSIIALEHDCIGMLANQHAVEEIERPIGYRM